MPTTITSLPDWGRALGPVLFAATIRSRPADFIVVEGLDIDLSDDGEHDFLWIEKTSANTQWVAERLAKHAKVAIKDVGFAGLKDRHAITRQWFSIRRPDREGTDWGAFSAEGVEIVEQHRHFRKLKRGAHKRNEFEIVLRGEDIAADEQSVIQRLEQIAQGGVPNYFGEQRFGRGGDNMRLARELFAGRRVSRARRSIALSAARSFLFNGILAERVLQGNWNSMLPGERANLDGSASVFAVEELDAEIESRCEALDIHPSGTLWGENAPLGTSDVAELERCSVEPFADLADGLLAVRVKAASRALRMPVRNLSWAFEDKALRLKFHLDSGGFATTVLRELAEIDVARPENTAVS